MKKKYYDGFIVHDILDAHLKPGKMMEVLKSFAEVKGVDAVEVIRCKDCVYFEGKPNGYCSMWSDDYLTKYRTDDDYCSDAERKESS